jgi:phosphopentomutase
MRSKKVIRYYCDHCNKGMFQKPAMARHEARCYRNRQRVCGRCGNSPDHAISADRKSQLYAIKSAGEKVTTVGGECPDCLMAYCAQEFPKGGVANPFEETILWYDREQYKKDVNDWHLERGYGQPDTGTFTL